MKKFFISLNNEFLKQKHNFTWPIAFGTSLLMGLLMFIDLYLRYDYLVKIHDDLDNSWEILLMENHFLWVFLFSLASVLITSLINSVELNNGGYRKTLSLPLKKRTVYFSKWLTAFIYSGLIIFFHIIILYIVGKILGFTDPIPQTYFFKYIFYEITAALGLVSLQFFISLKSHNFIISLTIGFVGVTSSYFFAQSKVTAILIPYTYPIFTLPLPKALIDTNIAFLGGLIMGIIILIIGMIDFSRRDIL